MGLLRLFARGLALLGAAGLLGACAHTYVALEPEPAFPVCSPGASALILWTPAWRDDQKDRAGRRAAAAMGLHQFFGMPGCFAQAEVRQVTDLTPASVAVALADTPRAVQRVVGIEVRELGPVVRLLSSRVLVEGATEVVLRVAEYAPYSSAELHAFVIHWREGGPGVLKGAASLPQDMQAALKAGLQAGAVVR